MKGSERSAPKAIETKLSQTQRDKQSDCMMAPTQAIATNGVVDVSALSVTSLETGGGGIM
jgi:hypothetical protein